MNVGQIRKRYHGGNRKPGEGVSHNGLENAKFKTVVANGEDNDTSYSISRVKPPPTSTRKIVLSKKGESLGLENVTVKSLDEIKRAKEMRKKNATNTDAGCSTATENPSTGHDSSSEREPIQSSSVTQNVIAKPVLIKPLTVQLKALPQKSFGPRKHKKTEIRKAGPAHAQQQPMDASLEDWSEPDCESTDDENFEEELIWEDEEFIESSDSSKEANEPEDSVKKLSDHARQDNREVEKQEDYIVDYSDVPLGSSHNEEDFMEMISLHPDDSLFDDDDDNDLDIIGRGKEVGKARSFGPKGDDSDLRKLIKSGQNNKIGQSSHSARDSSTKKKDSTSSDHCIQGTPVPSKNKQSNMKHRKGDKKGVPRPRGNKRNTSIHSHKSGPGVGRTGMGSRGRGHLTKARPPNNGPGILPNPINPALQLQVAGLLAATGLSFGPFINGAIQMNQGTFDKAHEHRDFALPEPPQQRRGLPWRGNPRGGRDRNDRRRGGRPYPADKQWGEHSPSRMLEHEERPLRQLQVGRKLLENSDAVVKHGKQQEPFAGVASEGNACSGERSRHHSNQEVVAGVIASGMDVGIKPAHAQVKDVPVPDQEHYNIDSGVTHTRSPAQSAKTSPFRVYEAEQPRPGNKRKSPAHNEHDAGIKVKIEASPTGEPGVVFAQPFGYCWQQLNTGQCFKAKCSYIHLLTQELQEYQQTGKIKVVENKQKNQAAEMQHPGQEDKQKQDQPAQQMPVKVAEKTPQEMTEIITAHLNKKELGAAWQVIEKMNRVHHTPELHILERLLLLCSEALSDPDIAGQVGCKVFDLIGRVRVTYTRHDYTTLVRCLCHCGQYIRAYEMLGVMRSVNCMPTHEVFVDLVQASHADPNWAFNLLDEVRRAGLFKTSICSSLLILGCKSGPDFVDRTLALFEEMVTCQVQPSKEAFNSLLQYMSDLECWDKLVFVLSSCPPKDDVTPEMVTSIMNHACHDTQLSENVLKFLVSISAKKDPGVDHKVWNSFLTACCSAKETALSTSQGLYDLMERLKVPLFPQSYNAYMKTLLGANILHTAIQLFIKMTKDQGIVQDPQSVAACLTLLSEACQTAGDLDNMLKVVHFMLDKQIPPPEKVLLPAVLTLDKMKNYKGIHVFFKQCQSAGVTPPLDVCRQIVSSLEKWEDPSASLEAYAALRRAYPRLPSGNQDVTELAASTESPSNQSRICRFYSTPSGCRYATKCKYLHSQVSGTAERPTGTPMVTDGQPANPFVLRKPCELLDTTPVVKMQPCPFPASSINFTHTPHVLPGSEPCGQTGSFKLIDPGPNQDVASVSSGSSLQQGLQFLQQSGEVTAQRANEGSFSGGPGQDLHPAVSTKTSPFQLHSSAVPGQHPLTVGSMQTSPRPPAAAQSTVRNPFTVVHPTEPRPMFWRTHSADSQNALDCETKIINQTHSAPASCAGPGPEHFNFPSKEKIEFYLPRIKYAGQERNWPELSKIYSDAKGAGVQIDHRLAQPFLAAFVGNTPDDTGDSFDSFLKELQLCLKEEDKLNEDTGAGFSADDEHVVGGLGVALMNLCFRTQRYREGYNVLYSLHECSINYSKCGDAVGLLEESMSEAAVALMAVEICLGVDPMQCDSALEVLRGCDYALSANSTSQSPDEVQRTRNVFQTLHETFLDETKFDSAHELLRRIGSVGPQKSLYNAFVQKLVKEGELDTALEIIVEMEANLISRDPETTRALVKGLGSAGKTMHAKRLFSAGCVSGVYPASFSEKDPWTVTVTTSFSASEAQFYLEKHLSALQEFTEKEATLHDDDKLEHLHILIVSDEAPRLYSGYMANEEIIRCVRNMVMTVLGNDFNPPLSCTLTERDEEIMVSPSNLRRWFLANPATRRHKKGVRAMNAMLARQNDTYAYLQPGMSNPRELLQAPMEDVSINTNSGNTGITVSLISQSSGQSERIVMQDDNDGRSAGVGSWHDLDRASKKALRDKVAHAICGQLTVYMREERIKDKEFREIARSLTQQFMEAEYNTITGRNYEEIRGKAHSFVDGFFGNV